MRSYLRVYEPDFGQEERSAVMRHFAIDELITAGKHVAKFEQDFAKYHNRRFATMTNSGSSALLLAIAAMKWAPGDRIITPACTFPTSISPLLHFGLVPVFVDIDIETLNVSLAKLFDAVSRTPGVTGAVLPHTLGNPLHPKAFDPFRLSVEDVCDAFGSRIDGDLCGTFGEASTFSFYPAHHITTGEGGMVLTGNPHIGKAVESMCSWGRDCYCKPGYDDTCCNRFGYQVDGVDWDHKYLFTHAGFNLKPLDLSGVLGNVQLAKAEGYRKIRKRNFRYIRRRLAEIEDALYLPVWEKEAEPNWFAYPVTLKRGNRKDICQRLETKGIATRLLFAGNLARQPMMKGYKYIDYGLENTDYAMRNTFLVGCHQMITEEECEYIANTVAEEVVVG